MNSQEILTKINDISWKVFQDINLQSCLANKTNFIKEVGDYNIIETKEYKGKEIVEYKEPYFIYSGKGVWTSIVIHFIKYDIYITERRFHIPKFAHGSCTNYKGSSFFEVKPIV